MPADQQQVHFVLLQGNSSGDEMLEAYAELQPALPVATHHQECCPAKASTVRVVDRRASDCTHDMQHM